MIRAAVIALMAAGCGDDPIRHLKDASITGQVGVGIYVTNENSTITVFDLGAEGDVAPLRTIAGDATQMSLPIGLGLDLAGNLYTANRTGSAVTVYPPMADGNVAPIRTLTSPGMGSPEGLLVLPSGEVYAVTCPSCGNSAGGDVGIYHFAPGATTTDYTIKGPTTERTVPGSPCVDGNRNLFIANSFGGEIATYAPGAQDDVAPVRRFTPSGNDNIQAMALIGASTLGLTVPGHGIDLFPRDATGTLAPAGTISQASLGLQYPGGMFIDTTVTPTVIFLIDYYGNAILEIQTSGSETQLAMTGVRMISGPTTTLTHPLNVTVVH